MTTICLYRRFLLQLKSRVRHGCAHDIVSVSTAENKKLKRMKSKFCCTPWLPDGIFSNQKNGIFGIFYGH
jgi:hypothetical protein